MTRLLYRLGRWCVRRRRTVLAVWIIAAIGLIVGGSLAGGDESATFTIPGAEAQHAIDVLESRFPAQSGTSAQLVFAVDDGRLSDTANAAAVTAALADIAAQPDVTGVSE